MSAADDDPYYLPADHIRFLLGKAEGIGLSAPAILRDCHQSYSWADIAEQRIGMLPQRDFVLLRNACIVRIWARVAERYRAAMSNADFELFCHSLITSLTLEEAIGRARRFLELMDGKAGRLALERQGDRACFVMNIDLIGSDWRFFFLCNAYSTFVRLFEWLIGETLDAEYETNCPDSEDNRATAAIFGERVRFGCGGHQIAFGAGLLGRPVIRTPAELRHFLGTFPFDAVVPRLVDCRLAPRIEGLYRTAIVRGAPLPRLVDLAGAVGVSAATLRRRLEGEGTSVQLLKDGVRRDLSLQYLRDRRMPLADVAARLGFSGPRSFGRAFRDWNGTSPAGYRRESVKAVQKSSFVPQIAHKDAAMTTASR